MRPSVHDLKAYYATADGRRVARTLARMVAPVVRRRGRPRLLALGYCAPLLVGLDPKTVERLAIVMPFAQGCHPFPLRRPNCTCLADELQLPFEASLFDQAIVCHALEFVEPAPLLRELWRVLAPDGELILIVPNRAGLWTHFEATPFGNGRPFGKGQLTRTLREAMFEPVTWTTALAAPPVRGLRTLDRLLIKALPQIGGIHLVLARKSNGISPALVGPATARLPATTPAGAIATARTAPASVTAPCNKAKPLILRRR